MNAQQWLVGFALASALAAQSPLTTLFAASHTVGGPDGGIAFFNLAANTTVTVNRIEVNTQSPVGTRGIVRLYRTVPPLTSFSGSELTPANWTLLATGMVV